MRKIAKYAGFLLIAYGMFGLSAPANAQVGDAPDPWIGPYDYYGACSYYETHDLPAPDRCYDYLEALWGPDIYADGDFVFRDYDDWLRWRDRDDYRHWKDHDFGRHAGDHDNHAFDSDRRVSDPRGLDEASGAHTAGVAGQAPSGNFMPRSGDSAPERGGFSRGGFGHAGGGFAHAGGGVGHAGR